MRISLLRILSFVGLIAIFTRASAQTVTVTLYPPTDPVTKKYDEGKACFSFKYGLIKQITKKDWQLGYGFLSISEQDWFVLNRSLQSRSVIKDLGEHKWEDSFPVPVLEPLSRLREGERREITVDSSAGTHQAWAKSTNMFAKVVLGHIYLVHVRDEAADFYAMFRVEEFEQRKYCTITWRLVPPAKPPEW